MFLFIGHGGYTWRSEVSVLKAELRSPDRLTLIVASCNKDPEMSLLRETDVDIQVKVIADSHPFLLGVGTVWISLRPNFNSRLEIGFLLTTTPGNW